MDYQFRADYLAGAASVAVAPATAAPHRVYGRVLKRVFDVLIVAMVSVPVLMVLLILGAIVALDGHSPLYMQDRVGRDGRVFRLFKLRSMVPDADAVLARTLACDSLARAEWDTFQKLRNDPRITRMGRLLRKSSLDELPQLFNVALGDMSIVGPRPIMLSQRAIYPGTEYYDLRPGITGYWQISVRNESSFSDRALFDRRYHAELSFATDVRIMARTAQVVLKGTGC